MTILNWSFPRKDLSRSAQAYQLALALREEVDDLQKAGCRVIQVGFIHAGQAHAVLVSLLESADCMTEVWTSRLLP